MSHDLTPDARRAVACAAAWTIDDATEGIDARSLLLGLLSDTDFQAAQMLARRGIDQSTVIKRWPDYRRREPCADAPPATIAPEVCRYLDELAPLLDKLPNPPALSTEHLLLALVDSSSSIGRWLRQRGLSMAEVRAEIYRSQGIEPDPIETEWEADLDTGEEQHAELEMSFRRATSTGEATGAASRVQRAALTRILDAAVNRAGEAIRVIEDYLRLGLDDAHLSSIAKEIRHELHDILSVIPMQQRLLARDTDGDVGTTIAAPREYRRGGAADVAAANFSRLGQSLRSIEEYIKVDHPGAAESIEQLRYRVYTLHRAVGVTQDSLTMLDEARLCVLIDGRDSIDAFCRLARSLVDVGVPMLQLRDKSLDDRALLARARALREITMDSPTLWIMNDRPDLALLADADGVHVGQEELTVRDVRKVVGEKLVGVSTHNIFQARRAVIDGANYLGVGPVFPSKTKVFDDYADLEFVRQVAAEIALPAFAIGGMDAENAGRIFEAGLHRLAVSSAVLHAPSPAHATEELLEVLGRRVGIAHH